MQLADRLWQLWLLGQLDAREDAREGNDDNIAHAWLVLEAAYGEREVTVYWEAYYRGYVGFPWEVSEQ